ncbi:hypothetical protein OPV22_016103 [Ensete ventricosum]|uniref:Pentacotripeptide-repeat region of PRORP domain-containing protein n=1 Tax=Ensete ventricosum TaxID=4639 RepID=A0AAV8QZ74_ENSVE|nr:hypothetical protein OPV22_016103 [Ensete ventricosum]
MAFSTLFVHPCVLPRKPSCISHPLVHRPSAFLPCASIRGLAALSTAYDLDPVHQVPPNFTLKDLLDSLRRQKDAESSVRLLNWASKQSHFTPTSPVYEEILHQLGKEGSFEKMIALLKVMQASDCKISQDTFICNFLLNVLVEGSKIKLIEAVEKGTEEFLGKESHFLCLKCPAWFTHCAEQLSRVREVLLLAHSIFSLKASSWFFTLH